MSENLPSEDEAFKLLQRSGCSKEVIKHCEAVAKLASKIAEKVKAKGINVDLNLIRIGAILHDIGRSKTHSVHHAIIGAKIARSYNLPEPIIHIIERHVGGGITAKEAKMLGWPEGVYEPKTIEEKIVTYADKLIEGSRVVPLKVTIRKLRKELGASHPAIKRILMLKREIESLLKDPS